MFPSDQRVVVVYGNRDDRNLRVVSSLVVLTIQFREFSQAGIKTYFSQTCFELNPL